MLKCSRGKKRSLATRQIDDFDLGMSASFIDRAPTPVVRLLSNDPGDHHHEHENCRLPHNHAGSINPSVLSDKQAKALAHTPILAGAEPTFGKNARKVNTQLHRRRHQSQHPVIVGATGERRVGQYRPHCVCNFFGIETR